MAHNKIVLVTIHQPTREALPDVHEGAAARQGRQARLLRHADGDARSTSPRRSTSSTSAPNSAAVRLRHHAAGVHLRCARDAAARSQRRHHLRGELAGPARARAPLLARLLARQIRELPPAPGREAGQRAQSRPRLAPTPVPRTPPLRGRERDPLARRVDAIPHALAPRLHLEAAQPRQSRPHPARPAAARRAHRLGALFHRRRNRRHTTSPARFTSRPTSSSRCSSRCSSR